MPKTLSENFMPSVSKSGHNFGNWPYVFSEKSFETSYLKCMSKSNIAGVTTGERLSKISESEILKLAHTPNYSNLDAPGPASSLLHSVSAACKNIPYTDEAASEARTKLFSMWYNLGPPAVFFTISPSFRIKLYVNQKMEVLPQPSMLYFRHVVQVKNLD
jgi:hypothetical protein